LPWLKESCRWSNRRARNLNLFEGVRAHEDAHIAFGVQVLHGARLKRKILQSFLRTEVRFPQSAAHYVDQFGLHYSAHLGGPGLGLHFENLVDLPLDANDHPFMQFGCVDHG